MRKRVKELTSRRTVNDYDKWKRELKLSQNDAYMTASNRKGYWAAVNTRTVKTALSNQRLEKAGFQLFLPYY